jgi:hypothetical protein
VHSYPASPVDPVVAFIAQEQPSATLLGLPGFDPTSYNSLSDPDDGLDAFHEVKFVFEVVLILEQLPKIKTAVFAVWVVIEGIPEVDVVLSVYQLEVSDTSKGLVKSTPEKATIAPAAAEEPEVTVNV